MTRFISAAFALSALGLAVVAQPAAAQTVHEGYSHDPAKIVTYAQIDEAGLDPASAAGARVLLDRIDAAADTVCAGKWPARSKAEIQDREACRAAAVAGAVSKVGVPAVKTLAARRRVETLAQN